MRPAFVTLEGTDGSGKSTQVRRIVDWLAQQRIEHLATHEPGGTPLGERIRECFIDMPADDVDGKLEAMLVFASRRHHLRQLIRPALAEGKVVICDRFTDSTMAYQGFGRGVDLDELRQLDAWATGAMKPDLTLLFELGTEAANRRTRKSDRANNRLDREVRDFYHRVQQGYEWLVAQEPDRFRVIDASGDVDETASRAIEALERWLDVWNRGELNQADGS